MAAVDKQHCNFLSTQEEFVKRAKSNGKAEKVQVDRVCVVYRCMCCRVRAEVQVDSVRFTPPPPRSKRL